MQPGNWILIAIIAILLILFTLMRRRGGATKYPEVVQSLLFDIKINQALAANFLIIAKPRRFENANWMLN